jgi:hypothetical protein
MDRGTIPAHILASKRRQLSFSINVSTDKRLMDRRQVGLPSAAKKATIDAKYAAVSF